MRAFRFFVSAILLLVLPGVAIAFWALGSELVSRQELGYPLLGGAFAGLIAGRLVLRYAPVFATFEHELTHALAGLVFLRRIRGIVVTRSRGGAVRHSGGFGGAVGDDFIGLAPYVLPTFTAIVVLAGPLIQQRHSTYWLGLVGLTFGYHVWSTLDELRRNWTSEVFPSAHDGQLTHTDIGRRGFLFSAIYIATVTLAIHGFLLALVLHGFPGAGVWAGRVWPATVSTISALGGC